MRERLFEVNNNIYFKELEIFKLSFEIIQKIVKFCTQHYCYLLESECCLFCLARHEIIQMEGFNGWQTHETRGRVVLLKSGDFIFYHKDLLFQNHLQTISKK